MQRNAFSLSFPQRFVQGMGQVRNKLSEALRGEEGVVINSREGQGALNDDTVAATAAQMRRSKFCLVRLPGRDFLSFAIRQISCPRVALRGNIRRKGVTSSSTSLTGRGDQRLTFARQSSRPRPLKSVSCRVASASHDELIAMISIGRRGSPGIYDALREVRNCYSVKLEAFPGYVDRPTGVTLERLTCSCNPRDPSESAADES